MYTFSVPDCVCLPLSAPCGSSRSTKMASIPLAPVTSIRCSTVPPFNCSCALRNRLVTGPNATHTANVIPSKQNVRFIERLLSGGGYAYSEAVQIGDWQLRAMSSSSTSSFSMRVPEPVERLLAGVAEGRVTYHNLRPRPRGELCPAAEHSAFGRPEI